MGCQQSKHKHEIKRLLIVSKTLNEYDVLVEAANSHIVVVTIDRNIKQIADVKNAIRRVCGSPAKQFASVAFADHGSPGMFALSDCIPVSMSDIVSPGHELADFFRWTGGYGRRIDLLACDVAAGAAGKAFLAELEIIAGVQVEVSTDKTGASGDVEDGFDWTLETQKKY